MRRAIRISVGLVLLLFGVVGIFLPLLQGWFFLILGALVLSIDIPVLNRLVCRLEQRFPGSVKYLERFRRLLVGKEEPPPTCPPGEGPRSKM